MAISKAEEEVMERIRKREEEARKNIEEMTRNAKRQIREERVNRIPSSEISLDVLRQYGMSKEILNWFEARISNSGWMSVACAVKLLRDNNFDYWAERILEKDLSDKEERYKKLYLYQ